MDAIKEAMIREEDTGEYNPALNPYRSRADALAALLRMKSCHARPGQSVDDCVDKIVVAALTGALDSARSNAVYKDEDLEYKKKIMLALIAVIEHFQPPSLGVKGQKE